MNDEQDCHFCGDTIDGEKECHDGHCYHPECWVIVSAAE
jgi:hypothetical protein